MGPEGDELIRAGRFFGDGYTNNEAEALAMMEALNCLDELRRRHPELDLPVRVWGDSQLIIRHLVGIYKKPSKVRVYQAIERAKELRRKWNHIAYRHIERGFNAVPDDMARRALAIRADVIYMPGQVPDDAPK